MLRTNLENRNFRWGALIQFTLATLILAGSFPARLGAQEAGQKTFASAEEASQALVAAAQANDGKAMLEVLGPSGKDIVSSGDAVEDKVDRENFVAKYQQMHRLVKEPDGAVCLYIGAFNWPTPIQIVQKGNAWYFDTEAGKKEILYRRVGRNEISAIRVSQELATAQKEYQAAQHEYAQKIFSDKGEKNGLYWKAAEGEPQSPIGPMVASARAEGYRHKRSLPPTPYRGYFFHVLTEQGKDAPGGAKSYIVNGKMTEGFGFVAFPAEYRSSGVMTFIVGSDGVVYEKDLGKKTEEIADEMKAYNPDSTWQKTKDEQEQAMNRQKGK
ncbi:MAG: DUF2950 domain-containing protein [Candidatus Acidiferrales bacterium]